ncbi:MAG: enoyl-CoA hydratase/isomerase family protein [Thermomicrobiales bacterium]
MTSIEAVVRIVRDGPVATITLNRPATLNAFDRALIERFGAALRTVDEDETVRVVIVTGAGRGFSAGQDTRELAHEEAAGGAAAVGRQVRDRYNPVILRLRLMEKPIIAAINGVATGAGLGVAMACDLRIASADASFVISPIAIGLIPAIGGTAMLPALIGLSRATELAFFGERIDAATAHKVGLVHRVVPSTELNSAAREYADRLAALPTTAIGLTKRAFNRAIFPDLAEHLAREADWQESAAGTAEHRQRLEALIRKQRGTAR